MWSLRRRPIAAAEGGHRRYIQNTNSGRGRAPAFGGYFRIHHIYKGGATPYIRNVKHGAPAHRSRLCAEGAYRRPQEIHPEYIQMPLAFGSVGEAAPPPSAGISKYTSQLHSFTGKIEEIANMSFLICYFLFQVTKIFDHNFSFLVWLYFCILHFTNQTHKTQIVIS